MTRPRTCRAAVLVLCGCLPTVSAWEAARSAPVQANPQQAFVVHEWGTFSTFSGSDGVYRKFYPDDRDLPEFVYHRYRDVKGGLPDVFVSLETPVLYFYSDRELTASIRVDFPKGRVTEWYPQANRPPVQGLAWDNVQVLPKGQPVALKEAGKSRYFAARETDACPVSITTDKGAKETEKFLFYRGVGDFTMPISVRALGKGAFQVKNTGKEAIPAFVLVRVQNGKVAFTGHDHLSAGSEVAVQQPREDSSAEKLGTAVAKLLVGQGLYEKEARAMVKTWSADWFGEDGVRVLYLVPGALTGEFLPLRVLPKPDTLIRVLVGRHDVLTPEREREVDALVKRMQGASDADAKVADSALNNQLGRYRWPAQSAAEARLKGQR